MKINFQSKIKQQAVIGEKEISRILAEAAKQLKIKQGYEISVIVVGEKRIRQLNQMFRQKDQVTDVLAFSSQEQPYLFVPPEAKNYLGEIFICYPQLVRQAKKYKKTIKQEYKLLLIHGLLHLLGYDHETDNDYKKMKVLEDKLMQKI